MTKISPKQAELIYRALVRHDGRSLHPELGREEAKALTRALDDLRLFLLETIDAGEVEP